jgi:hypothetical protein
VLHAAAHHRPPANRRAPHRVQRSPGASQGASRALRCHACASLLDTSSLYCDRSIRCARKTVVADEEAVGELALELEAATDSLSSCRYRLHAPDRGHFLSKSQGNRRFLSNRGRRTFAGSSSESLWPVPHAPLPAAAKPDVRGPGGGGWWARVAGQGPTRMCAAEVGLGPRGLGEGRRQQSAQVPMLESHLRCRIGISGAGMVRGKSR